MATDTFIDKTISHFHILEKLGEGGMGRVYKAMDTRLQRLVAIKFITPELVKDKNAVRRFQIEAIAASAINHPNICTIFEIDSRDGYDFIVMEYVEGQSLRALLHERGRLTPKEIIDILRQLCEALSGAHKKGIVHRDIKPDNILLTPDGQVKITDFGLAKLASETLDATTGALSFAKDATNQSLYLTSMSQHLGTLAYMSPEQLRNVPVDQRTDIFAIGTLLYELATGQRPFDRNDSVDAVQAILEANVSFNKADVKLSPVLAAVISNCLQKQPHDRPQSTTALLHLLDIKKKVHRGKKVLAWTTALFITAFMVLTLWFVTRERDVVPLPGYSTPLDKMIKPLITSKNTLSNCDFSPDGSRVVYLEKRKQDRYPRMLIKNLNTGSTTELTDGNTAAFFPSWSRDGKHVACSGGTSSIWLYDLSTFERRQISDRGIQPRWSMDDSLILCQQGQRPQKTRLHILSVDDFRIREIKASADSLSLMSGDWHPNGESIICLEGSGSRWRIVEINIVSGEIQELAANFKDVKHLRVAPDGSGIYYPSVDQLKPNITFVTFDELAQWPYSDLNHMWLEKPVGDFNISRDGQKIMYSTDEDRSNLVRFKIKSGHIIRARDKEMISPIQESYPVYAISPDSQFVALEDFESGSRHIWLIDIHDKNKMQLTFGQECFSPTWSPDSRWVAFDRGGGERADIWKISIDGSTLEPVVQHPGADWMPSWSPTNNYIAFLSSRSGDMQIWLHELRTGEEWQLTDEKLQVWYPVWHPDGQHIAYALDNRGVKQVKMINIDSKEERLFPLLKQYGGHPRLYFGFKRDGNSIYQFSFELFEYKLPNGPLSQLSTFTSENFDLRMGYTGFMDTRDGHLWGAEYESKGDIWVIEERQD